MPRATQLKQQTWTVTYTVHVPEYYLESDVTEVCVMVMDGTMDCPSDYDVVNVRAEKE